MLIILLLFHKSILFVPLLCECICQKVYTVHASLLLCRPRRFILHALPTLGWPFAHQSTLMIITNNSMGTVWATFADTIWSGNELSGSVVGLFLSCTKSKINASSLMTKYGGHRGHSLVNCCHADLNMKAQIVVWTCTEKAVRRSNNQLPLVGNIHGNLVIDIVGCDIDVYFFSSCLHVPACVIIGCVVPLLLDFYYILHISSHLYFPFVVSDNNSR